MINWWRISFGEDEIKNVENAINGEHISQGVITEKLEQEMAQQLSMPYAVATTSGSVALLLSLMAYNIGPGDEVIVPNRTWIATANAPYILGAKVVLVDVLPNEPSMDIEHVRKNITDKTRAIIPVHLNGRAVDIKQLKEITKEKNIVIIEDACQALFSQNENQFLGTEGDMGCFSFATTKMISTAQGGMIVTHDREMYEKIKLLRWHGAGDNIHPVYRLPGCNFKFTDIQAALGLAQLAQKKKKIEHMVELYKKYEQGLEQIKEVQLIKVDLSSGELPLYIEVLSQRRDQLAGYLLTKGIKTRPALPNVNRAPYLNDKNSYTNADRFERNGLFLPCGPAQPMENVDAVLNALREWT